jgi:endonuclease-3 related protein
MPSPSQAVALTERLLAIYHRLLAAYGPQGWWPGADDPFVVAVGAILTQNVSWSNVEKALSNLRAAGVLSPQGILALDEAALGQLIRPAGYFLVKARRLQALCRMLAGDFGGDLSRLFALPLLELRARLLATYGIGEETADDIILYAAHRPVFVVDAYTVRLFTRLGITPASPGGRVPRYQDWQGLFMAHLPADVALLSEYHALIVRHSVIRCLKRRPACGGCPLYDLCPAGLAAAPGTASADGRALPQHVAPPQQPAHDVRTQAGSAVARHRAVARSSGWHGRNGPR